MVMPNRTLLVNYNTNDFMPSQSGNTIKRVTIRPYDNTVRESMPSGNASHTPPLDPPLPLNKSGGQLSIPACRADSGACAKEACPPLLSPPMPLLKPSGQPSSPCLPRRLRRLRQGRGVYTAVVPAHSAAKARRPAQQPLLAAPMPAPAPTRRRLNRC
jgi:hypothetical protein